MSRLRGIWSATGLAALAAIGLSLAVQCIVQAAEPEVVFLNESECQGAHAVYRWDVKIDYELPPETIPAVNKVTPSVIGQWPPLQGVTTTHTPRSAREKDWFELTGKVSLVKAEADGDLHIQLVDVSGPSQVNVVVEVPAKQHLGDSPWTEIRKTVFGWTNQTFPFTVTSSKNLNLTKSPVIRVQGKAFFDAQHKGPVPNRRQDEPNREVTVWEIHPVMVLDVLQDN